LRHDPPADPMEGVEVPDLKPKKWPRQARSRATFDRILAACARLLEERELASVTTNHVALRARVSIGTLYEFFPNRDAIVAVLARRRLADLRTRVQEALATAARLDPWDAARFVLGRIVDEVARERCLFRVLLREAPFLREEPEIRRAIGELFGLGRPTGARGAAARPHRTDAGLLGRVLASAVVEIALSDASERDRRAVTDELARLAFRLALRADPVSR
jgi:AcrR family transcriptional regulator